MAVGSKYKKHDLMMELPQRKNIVKRQTKAGGVLSKGLDISCKDVLIET